MQMNLLVFVVALFAAAMLLLRYAWKYFTFLRDQHEVTLEVERRRALRAERLKHKTSQARAAREKAAEGLARLKGLRDPSGMKPPNESRAE